MFAAWKGSVKKTRGAQAVRRSAGRRLVVERLEERLALSGGAASIASLLFPLAVSGAEAPAPLSGPASPAVSPQTAAGLVLTSPTPWQIVQRDAHNLARLEIAGSLDAPWTRVEARAVVMPGFAGNATGWEAIDVTPESSGFSGELVVSGGWYQLEVRAFDGQDVVAEADVSRLGVGEVFVTAGQSNAANGGWPRLTPDDERVAAYGPNGWQFAADPQPFASGSGGTPWSVLGGLLAAEFDVPVGLISLAWGSTSVADWQPGGEHYQRLADALDYLGPEGFRAVLWHQGEADAYWSTPTADYAERLGRIIAQSRADAGWDVPWGVALASFTADSAPESRAAVVAGQQQVIDEDPLVFQGASTDDLLGFDWRYDNLHFNEAGLREHAARWFTPVCQLIAAPDAWTPTALDLGAAEDRELTGLDLSAGDLWYRVEAVRDGLLTLLAGPGGTPGDVALAFYDPAGNLLAESPAGGPCRIDRAITSGSTHYVRLSGTADDASLRLVNLVSPSADGSGVTVYGTDGDDRLAVSPHRGLFVAINGIEYQFSTATQLTAFGGGGHDVARLYDSPGDDTFAASPRAAVLEGDGFRMEVRQFEAVHAYANGGDDIAKLYDSVGDDRLVATPSEAALSGEGFYLRAKHFEAVHAYANGGDDTARLYDSAGDDRLVAGPVEVALFGQGFYRRAKHFETVHAYATVGHDTAEITGSAGDDQMIARPIEVGLLGAGFYRRAKQFDEVTVRAGGGFDSARLYDSPGDETFFASATEGAMLGAAFANRFKGFERVVARSSAGGHDVAKLYDSAGDDRFTGAPTFGELSGAGFSNRVEQFEEVHAYANGGHDVAWLFDSAGDDMFDASPVQSMIWGQGFYTRAKAFERVYADAGAGGYDTARLGDSASIDLLEVGPSWARLSNAALDFLYQAGAFDHVRAVATTPGDTVLRSPVLSPGFVLELEGTWQER